MQKRGDFLSYFFLFLILSFFTYLVFQTPLGSPLGGALQVVLHPIQRVLVITYASATNGQPTQLQQLEDENTKLRLQLAEQNREIQALHDQFATEALSSQSLLPAKIVGFRTFIPGVSAPTELVIDKGKADGVSAGAVVVSKNILVGRITKVTDHGALVDLTSRDGFSLTAKTSKTNALGIVTGQGNGDIVLQNVVLSDNLEKGDLVLTKGSMNEEGIGSPPDLVVGKIASVDKKPSALFQTAKIAPLVDVKKLEMVFILQTR
jgi:rod shape-determining protein MreC